MSVLSLGSPAQKAEALLSLAYHDPDGHWVEELCLSLVDDLSPEVRGMAAMCFGHLARIHGRLDLDRVLPVLRRLAVDPLVAPRANDALDDIEVYLRPPQHDVR